MAIEPIDKAELLETDTARQDQRRPGRRDQVSPQLIGLLRGAKGAVDSPPDDQLEDNVQFNPRGLPRGIVLASLMSAAAWVLIAFLGWIGFKVLR